MSKICDHRVYSPLKLLFKAIIKRAFFVQFDFHCPRSLHTIRDLSFVPHLIGVNCYWKDIKIDRLFEYLAVPDNDQERVLRDPGAAIDAFPRLEEVGGTLVNYRLQIRQAIPTRLKSIFSWNINSWSHPNCVRQDPKTRRCKKLLRSGPVLLQETKWQKCRSENIIQHLAGTQVASSPAIPTDKDAWSGGVAIITPAGWQIESEYELLQGRAVAVLVRDRTAPFYLISVYLHPNNTCTCSCLFTTLTEGRSARDLTQAATSQKKKLGIRNRKDELTKQAKRNELQINPKVIKGVNACRKRTRSS